MRCTVSCLCLFVAIAVAHTAVSAAEADGAEILAMDSFTYTNPTVAPYAPIRAHFDGSGWSLQPNQETPANCLGWLEGPRLALPKAANNLSGNNAVLRIDYTFNTNTTDAYPAVRFRLNTTNWTRNSAVELSPPLFREQRSTGRGTATLMLDRSTLPADATVRLFVDLYGIGAEGTVDPAFFVRLEKVEFLTSISDSSYARQKLISIAYREDSGNVYAHLGGDSVNRTLLRARAERFVYDGAYCAVIDEGVLYGYAATTGLQETQIDPGRVKSVSISDHQVFYLMENGDLKLYNFLTGEKKMVLADSNMWALNAAGDGTLSAMELDDEKVRVYQYDTRAAAPALTRLSDDYKVIDMYNRDCGFPIDFDR